MKSEFFFIIIPVLIASLIQIQQAESDGIAKVSPKVSTPTFISEILDKKMQPDISFSAPSSDLLKAHPSTIHKNIKEEASSIHIVESDLLTGNSTGPNICIYKFRDIFLFQSSMINDHVTVETNVTTIKIEDKKEDIVEKPTEKKEIDWEMDSMQSFEEWKKLKLQQLEEKKEKFVPHIPPTLVRAKKSKVNYASQDCGAKILAYNKEAKHVSAILDENRDLYMLNPCSAGIWFVIELCEPIQVEEIQLCNLELFSSAPKEFTVSLSERFPAREWHSAGTFLANNVRQLQAFVPTTETKMFAKYIKFDMTDHFSHEHFCPLTLVRILGASMADEFDTEQPNPKEDTSEHHPHEKQEKKNGDDGAINTMINMVKNAMDHVLNGPETEEFVGSDKPTPDANMHDDSIVNTTESELVLVLNERELSNSFDFHGRNGTFNDLGEKYHNLRMFSKLNLPLYIPKYINSVNPLKNQFEAGMCWILEFFCKVSLSGCHVHYPAYYGAGLTFISFSNFSVSPVYTGSSIHDGRKDVKNYTFINMNLQGNSDIKRMEMERNEGYKEDFEKEPGANNNSMHQVNSSSVETNEEMHKNLDEKSPQDPIYNDIGEKSGYVQPSELENELGLSVKLNEYKDKVVNNVKDVSETDNSMSLENYEELPNSDKNIANGENDTKSHNAPELIALQEVSNESRTNFTQPSNISAQTQTANEQASVSPTMIINSAVNQKDSVFMRLSNRIRALEENMSLSSDYLETLSQRYKKQMDEMQRAFNQTTARLLSTAKTANENDAKQTELINFTQEHLKELDQRIQDLALAHDQLNYILVERHLSLLLIEIFVFVATLFLCIGRQMRHLQKKVETAENMIQVLQKILKKYEKSETNHPLHLRFPIDITEGFPCHPKQNKYSRSRKSRKKKESRGNSVNNVLSGYKTSPNQQKLNQMRVEQNNGACEDLLCPGKKNFSESEYKTWKAHPMGGKTVEHDKGRK